MQPKYTFLLVTALAATFASAPLWAQRGPKDLPPPPPPPQQGEQSPLPQPPPTRDYSKESDMQRTILGAYRLTYTLTEMDGTKRLGSKRYAIVLDADARATTLKLGVKIPVATGESKAGAIAHTDISYSYIDLGMNIQATLRQFANGLELRSHIVESAVDPQQSVLKTPVIRYSDMESTVLLNENKPVILGNVDTPGNTHSLQIQVELTRVQ